MANPILTQEYVCSLFEYRDGYLYWKERPISHFLSETTYKIWSKRFPNKRAGDYSTDYAMVKINRHPYLVHRIIFLMHHGYSPEMVDHIDCNPKNNRIENLRAATRGENISNQKLSLRNKSGYKGVSWHKHEKKWRVSITVKRKSIHIGNFKNIKEADQAAREARNKYHGAFARHE